MKYKKGTQAMLDAAKDDATLLPYDTVFMTANKENAFSSSGVEVVRENSRTSDLNDSKSVRFAPVVTHISGELFAHIQVKNLLPAKKTKHKKWQNGTKAQLDSAKDDARLIPKKTYFRHKEGYIYHRIPCEENCFASVLMVAWGSGLCPRMVCSEELEPIND